jgi:hypothetical protein
MIHCDWCGACVDCEKCDDLFAAPPREALDNSMAHTFAPVVTCTKGGL